MRRLRGHRRGSSLTLTERRRRIFFARLRILLIFGAVVMTVIMWLATRSQFEISEVTVNGTTASEALSVQSVARSEISHFYLGIIPKSLSFVVPKDAIRATLLDGFKNFESVSIKRSGLKTLVISVTERLPDALWCRRQEDRKHECYYMDDNGLVFDHVKTGDEEGRYVFYGFLDHVVDPIGAQYLSPERLREIRLFLGTLQGVDLRAVSFERTDDKEYKVVLERGTTLILNETGDLNHALSNVSSLLNDAELKEQFEKNPLPFEYIDLRLEKKVFFKRR
jgi:hypothetical protein